MPEGHIIHRLAKELGETLGGRPVQASSPQGRFADGASRIDGEALVKAEAWGKYLFCDFGIGEILHIHLGLIGKLRRRHEPIPEPVGVVRLRMVGEADAWDLSGPSRCELLTPGEKKRIVSGIGADPLRRGQDVAAARAKFAASSRPVGAVILDQSVIAGIGNVYRAEVLFLCGINPARPAKSLSDAEFDELWNRTVELMRIGKRLGRIVTTDPKEVGVSRARMGDEDRLYAYHQEFCRRCGSPIDVAVIGGRPIWYCPKDQPIDG
ncbi:MAG: DNA-formamidopyrimidine glycosylase family protein [Microthrixaceae bacterium]